MIRDVWTCIDPEKESEYAYFDSLWFNTYMNGNDKSDVLRWIKAKKIFSRRYVFVPIVCWYVTLILILWSLLYGWHTIYHIFTSLRP
jgi:hypothetical protein